MNNGMNQHAARDVRHDLHDKVTELETALMVANAVNRKLMDRIEALTLDLKLKDK